MDTLERPKSPRSLADFKLMVSALGPEIELLIDGVSESEDEVDNEFDVEENDEDEFSDFAVSANDEDNNENEGKNKESKKSKRTKGDCKLKKKKKRSVSKKEEKEIKPLAPKRGRRRRKSEVVVKKDKKEKEKRKSSLDIEIEPPTKQYSNERSKQKQEENDQIRKKFSLGELKGQQSMDDIDIEVIKHIRRKTKRLSQDGSSNDLLVGFKDILSGNKDNIDGAIDKSLSPGDNYFFTEEDKELLKKLEEQELLKSFQAFSSLSYDFNKKKIMKIPLFKKEKQEKNEVGVEHHMKQVQLIREKYKKDMLLPEGEDLDQILRMRNKTINELLLTEKDYLEDLIILIECFQQPLLSKNIIDSKSQNLIFSNIDVIRNLNQGILKKIETEIQKPTLPQISSCFVELTSYQKIYFDYCSNHHNAIKHVKVLSKKSNSFRQYLLELQSHPRCNGMSLSSYLIKPIQRICKYPLLLRELIKYTTDGEELDQLEVLLENISTFVNAINNKMKEAENISKIIKIQRMLGMKAVELLQPGRIFIKEAHFEEYTGTNDTQTNYVVLFNDSFVRAEKKKGKFGQRRKEKYQLLDSVPIYSISVSSFNSIAAYPNSFEISYLKKKIILCPETTEERDDWLNCIQLYKKNVYDETSLSRGSGDFQSSLRTLSDNSDLLISSTIKRQNLWKCYLDKGTQNQRIRKIALEVASDANDLICIIKKDFDFDTNFTATILYEDTEGDEIEINHSLSVCDILIDAKHFLIRTSSSEN